MTPERRASAVEWARVVFSWRDVCSILAIIYLLWMIKSDLRDLNTHFEAYQKLQDSNFLAYKEQQAATLAGMQHQIDEWRAQAKLAMEHATAAEQGLSEVKGYLDGAGIKGAAGNGNKGVRK